MDAQEPSYGIGAVARRLGVPAPTLRTWNARYHLGPSGHSPGGHRRYTPLDLARLEEMNRLIRSGAPAAEAAAAALKIRSVAGARAAREAADETGHGNAPVLSSIRLARAAAALDGWQVSELLDQALRTRGVPWTWEKLVLPAMASIVRRQAQTDAAIDVEHLFSERVTAALAALLEQPVARSHPRPVLLACAQDEQHSLPLFALGATLSADHEVDVRVLGARTPYPALADAMTRLNPAVVFIWSSLAETGDPAPLARLPRLRPPSVIMTGGPGWYGLPDTVVHLTSLPGAVDRIMAELP